MRPQLRGNRSPTWRGFLAALMSTKTCYKIVVACGQAGFLLRERNPCGTIFAVGRQSGVLFRAALAWSAPTDREGTLIMVRSASFVLMAAAPRDSLRHDRGSATAKGHRTIQLCGAGDHRPQ
jgi:hypothetical protein